MLGNACLLHVSFDYISADKGDAVLVYYHSGNVGEFIEYLTMDNRRELRGAILIKLYFKINGHQSFWFLNWLRRTSLFERIKIQLMWLNDSVRNR